ncbi:NADH-quinone oxidoreductase subunit M [Candidatus Bathyarchaeota archaeon]|nr:NADH-quinone oxidoreductase subunit M [Candidatus Bathyarchaeota archaeon]MBS7630024.1 NADH-quinone oxidoreductase subunit M [Candidatus Bathyarchaeota archaeon]
MVIQEFSITQLPLPLTILLLGGLFTPILGSIQKRFRLKRIREFWASIVVALTLYSIYLVNQQLESKQVLVVYLWGQSPPLGGSFEIDALSIFMSGTIAFLGLLVVIYSSKYMEKEGRLTEFYTLVLLMMAGMTGIVMAGDFFTLFVFWELMGLSSYVLVAFLKSRWGPVEAGFKYLLMSATASAFLLLTMSLLYGMAGTLNFAYLASSLRGSADVAWMTITFSMLIIGFGVKSAIVPLHTWLPDAHPEAPSPISALLSGVVIETGLYGLTRLLFILFEPDLFKVTIASLAVVTMSLANIWAILQQDIKRLLAYSSIAQIGYMLIGISTGTTFGVMGTFLHVFNHSIMKGLAFLSAGSIVQKTGTRDIQRLKGVGRRMPYTTFALLVAFLGLGGVPATNGFISKLILFGSAIGAGMPLLTVIGVLNSAFSMAYYLRVIKTLVSKPEKESLDVSEAPIIMVGVTTIMAIIILVTGLFPNILIEMANGASESLIKGLDYYIRALIP